MEDFRSDFSYYTKDAPSWKAIDIADKDSVIRYNVLQSLRKTYSMFEYGGSDIDKIVTSKRYTELSIQTRGYAGLIEFEGQYHVVQGFLGGERDAEYFPKDFIVANPWLKCYKTFHPKVDCVIIPNDSFYIGLIPIFSYYAQRIAETVMTKRIAIINMRAFYALKAPTQQAKDAIDKFFKDLEAGKLSSIFDKSGIISDIQALPYSEKAGVNMLTQFIEDEQYLKASLMNEIGLQANYNMKRESINSNEAQLNQDALIPYCVNMEEMRKIAIEEQAKEVFGLDLTVNLSNVWKKTLDVTLNSEESNQLDDDKNDESSNQLDKGEDDENGDDSDNGER